MAARGDVLALRKAIGFLPGERLERYVVLQTDDLTAVLDTVVVAPLDHAHPDYAALPGLVPIAAGEAGTASDQVAIVPQLLSLPLDRFEVAPVGRAGVLTLRRIEGILLMLFELE